MIEFELNSLNFLADVLNFIEDSNLKNSIENELI